MRAMHRPLTFLIVIAALKVLLVGYWVAGGSDLIGRQSNLEAPTLAAVADEPLGDQPPASADAAPTPIDAGPADAVPADDGLQTLAEAAPDEPAAAASGDDDLQTLDETLAFESAAWRELLAPSAALQPDSGLRPLVDDAPLQEIADVIEPADATLGWPAAVPWTIRPGEVISAIATRFGVPNQVVLQFNDIGATDVLSVGLVVWIPSRYAFSAWSYPSARDSGPLDSGPPDSGREDAGQLDSGPLDPTLEPPAPTD